MFPRHCGATRDVSPSMPSVRRGNIPQFIAQKCFPVPPKVMRAPRMCVQRDGETFCYEATFGKCFPVGAGTWMFPRRGGAKMFPRRSDASTGKHFRAPRRGNIIVAHTRNPLDGETFGLHFGAQGAKCFPVTVVPPEMFPRRCHPSDGETSQHLPRVNVSPSPPWDDGD